MNKVLVSIADPVFQGSAIKPADRKATYHYQSFFVI
jgi:hypothetical protein